MKSIDKFGGDRSFKIPSKVHGIELTIEVNDVIPSAISYNPNAFIETIDVEMTLASPIFTGTGGTITSWEVYPTLPTGLSLDTSTGEISGTPTVLSTQTTYTIYANNTGGSSVTTIDVTVSMRRLMHYSTAEAHTHTPRVLQ